MMSDSWMIKCYQHTALVNAIFPGASTKCSHNICANRGICVQQWNSYACDCDMTSYTGPTCSDGKYFKHA